MKRILSILVLVFCLACSCKTNTDALSTALSSLTAEDASQVITPKNVYVIIDGSGSGTNKYALLELTIASIEQLVDKISLHGGGHLYLNADGYERAKNGICDTYLLAMGAFVGLQDFSKRVSVFP